LIPSVLDYARKFKQLDPLDFKIIRAMYECGVQNLSRIADIVGAPQQTVSYRVERLVKKDLVRFRAVIDETRLGLRSFSVFASSAVDREEIAGSALTCFPLWRYLAITDGWRHGNYVRYAIPPDKERDLAAFLDELMKRDLIFDFEMVPTSGPRYPLLDLDFYVKGKAVRVFDWQKWVENYDSIAADKTDDGEQGKAEFDLVDLVILRCLELNARISQRRIVRELSRILEERNLNRFIPLVSRRIRNRIIPQGFIGAYRTYLFPNEESTALLFILYLTFSSSLSLRRFVSLLKCLPYNNSYEEIVDKRALLVRLVLPAYEYSNMRSALARMAQNGFLEEAHLLLGDLAYGTWDNVEIYQMFRDDAWNFSYGAAVEMLEKTLKGT
jgi:DNA-binding Lrp family transcriptional regulator